MCGLNILCARSCASCSAETSAAGRDAARARCACVRREATACVGPPRLRRSGAEGARRAARRVAPAAGSRGVERSEGARHGAAWRVARGCRQTWSGAVEAGEMGEDRADAWGPQGRERRRERECRPEVSSFFLFILQLFYLFFSISFLLLLYAFYFISFFLLLPN